MKFTISLKSFDKRLMYQAVSTIVKYIEQNNSKIVGTIFLPKKIKKFCVLRSPHIDKSSREQLEIRIHKCIIYSEIISLEMFTNFLNIEIPAGVDCDFFIPESL